MARLLKTEASHVPLHVPHLRTDVLEKDLHEEPELSGDDCN